MFGLEHIVPNLARYPRWITEAHTWFIWIAVMAPLWIAARARHRPTGWAAFALIVAVFAIYLPYIHFHPEEWFYTRFLLPSIALMLLFACVLSLHVVRRLPGAARVPAIVAGLGVLIAAAIGVAESRGAFSIHRQEQKYVAAGTFVRDRLPSTTFVLAAQHSGSIRYYAGRPTLRWDLLQPAALDRAVADIRAAGYTPVVVVDAGEDPVFRERFGSAGQASVRQLVARAVLGDARVYTIEP
jgi:hypothetical protein